MDDDDHKNSNERDQIRLRLLDEQQLKNSICDNIDETRR